MKNLRPTQYRPRAPKPVEIKAEATVKVEEISSNHPACGCTVHAAWQRASKAERDEFIAWLDTWREQMRQMEVA